MSEQGFYRYAKRHPGATFPTLPYRGQFNRLLRRHYGAMMAFLSQKGRFLRLLSSGKRIAMRHVPVNYLRT